jgi:RNA polymerase sigma factor (sigma-70 family)
MGNRGVPRRHLLSVDISDGDLVRRARSGDAGAFRLLVERHFRPASTLAARLGQQPDDVDDIVQEAFLQAFLGLDRLRDPDRFGAWLAGIVRNVHRAARREAPLTLLAEWPEDLHPASAHGLPSADDLDRAEALRAAVARLPDGQRRAVELYYYADVPAGQIGGSPGAVKVSLHKARRRLREHITVHRPDLIPLTSRRTAMTTVRIACAEPHLGARPDGSAAIGHILVVLADDAGHRAMGLWLRARHGLALWRILGRPAGGLEPGPSPRGGRARDLPVREFSPEELAGPLLAAADGTVTRVEIDELGPNVLAAQITVTSPAGVRQVTAHPGSALALAVALAVPVQVASPLLDRLAVPVTPDDLLGPFERRTPPRPSGPRSGPRNLDFADGLSDWIIRGRSLNEVTGAHRNDYAVTAAAGEATLSAAVPEPGHRRQARRRRPRRSHAPRPRPASRGGPPRHAAAQPDRHRESRLDLARDHRACARQRGAHGIRAEPDRPGPGPAAPRGTAERRGRQSLTACRGHKRP